MHKWQKPCAEEFAFRLAERSAIRRTYKLKAALEVDLYHQVALVLHQEAVALAALSKRLLHVLAIGNVGGYAL